MSWRDATDGPFMLAPSSWSVDVLERRLLEAHRECAQMCMEANHGSLAMTLSGGLDSTLSLAMLRSIYPGSDIRTYTVGGSRKHPDLQFGEMAARTFGCTPCLVIPTRLERIRVRKELAAHGSQVTDGAVGVYCLYRRLAKDKARIAIAHDGIDELMGGYWNHRASDDEQKMRSAFEYFWSRLVPDHLLPLERTAVRAGARPVFPYLHPRVVAYIARIPLTDRTSREESKKPLRALARRFGVPEEIIARTKRGFCDALCKA
ncbi:MAG: asparagine synthase-related protein [Candidatus Uhrbacteria bacterium]